MGARCTRDRRGLPRALHRPRLSAPRARHVDVDGRRRRCDPLRPAPARARRSDGHRPAAAAAHRPHRSRRHCARLPEAGALPRIRRRRHCPGRPGGRRADAARRPAAPPARPAAPQPGRARRGTRGREQAGPDHRPDRAAVRDRPRRRVHPGWPASSATCSTPGSSRASRCARRARCCTPTRPTSYGASDGSSACHRTATSSAGGWRRPGAACSTVSRSPTSRRPSASTTSRTCTGTSRACSASPRGSSPSAPDRSERRRGRFGGDLPNRPRRGPLTAARRHRRRATGGQRP